MRGARKSDLSDVCDSILPAWAYAMVLRDDSILKAPRQQRDMSQKKF
jgi:hypothetical protein